MDEQRMINVELIPPMKQKPWGWPATLNFILGGTGTGFYLFSFLTAAIESGVADMSKPIPFGLLGPLLVCLGLLALIIETGRPLRSRYLFRNMWYSWISRETLACAIFVLAVVLDRFFAHLGFRLLAVAGALALMISQGFIVYRAQAVTAWNVPVMPVVFMSSGLASGGGLALLVAAIGAMPLTRAVALMGLTYVILNLAVWLLYQRWSSGVAFRLATDALRRPITVLLTVGLGHLVPLVLLLLVLTGPDVNARVNLPYVITALSGLAMIVGVMSQKIGIILVASYTRAIVLRH